MAFLLRSSWLVSFWLFVATLVAAPLPLGSGRDWAWAPLAGAIGVIGLIQALGSSRRPLHSAAWRWLIVPAIALVALIAWALIQATTAPWPAAASPMVAQAYEILRTAGHPRTALRPDATMTAIMLWLAYALAFWIALNAAQDIRRARQIMIAMVAAGAASTAYAVLAAMMGAAKGDPTALIAPLSTEFSGTFDNRNTYATLAGLCALVALTLLQMNSPGSRPGDEPLRLRVRRFLQRSIGFDGVLAILFLLFVVCIFVAGSRGGLLALASGLLANWLLGRRRSMSVLAVGAVLGILLLASPLGTDLVGRYIGLTTGRDPRVDLLDMAQESISLRPWTGWGIGSFESLFLILQPMSLVLFQLSRVYNTYLELVVELGIPFGMVLPAIVLWIVARCVLGLWERARDRRVPALAISAAVLVGIHSMVDYSLQVPAVGLFFAVLLGIGWAQSWSSRRN